MSTEIDFKTWLKYPGTKLLLILIVFLVAETVILFEYTRRSASKPGATGALEIGEKISEVQATDLNNATRKIDFSTTSKLVFILSTTCPACDRNFDNWKEIEARVGRENVVYLSPDPISDSVKMYAAGKGIADRLVVFSSVGEKAKLKIYRIPQTIYIRNGEVKAVQVGILSPEKLEMFKSMFSPIEKET